MKPDEILAKLKAHNIPHKVENVIVGGKTTRRIVFKDLPTTQSAEDVLDMYIPPYGKKFAIITQD